MIRAKFSEVTEQSFARNHKYVKDEDILWSHSDGGRKQSDQFRPELVIGFVLKATLSELVNVFREDCRNGASRHS